MSAADVAPRTSVDDLAMLRRTARTGDEALDRVDPVPLAEVVRFLRLLLVPSEGAPVYSL